MNIELNSRLVSRNDTTANWTANKNVVLLKGEVGIEFTTTGNAKLKIGDGVTTWENLDYFGGAVSFSGDGNTISISVDGVVSIVGFTDAVTNAFVRKGSDGSIVWSTIQLSDITDFEDYKTSVNDKISNAVSTATTALDNLADKLSILEGNVYTKTEVDGKFGGVFHYMGNYTTYSALLADVTNKTITPSKGDVWNIQTAGGTDYSGVSVKAGDNVAYNGTGWDVLSGTVDLSAYVTSSMLDDYVQKVEGSRLMTSAEVAKLAGITAGAEVNILEGVQINGSDLTISNKKVNVPLAGSAPGVVISSTGENEVSVDTSGKMQVNSINISKVVQSTGDTLVLNGGSAS